MEGHFVIMVCNSIEDIHEANKLPYRFDDIFAPGLRHPRASTAYRIANYSSDFMDAHGRNSISQCMGTKDVNAHRAIGDACR